MRALYLLIGTALAACGISLDADAAEAAHPLLSEGRSAYKQLCAHCHGIDMVNPGTGSFDLRRWPVDRKDDFVAAVMHGKGDMPAWGDLLSAEEIEALWVYVATRGGKQTFPE